MEERAGRRRKSRSDYRRFGKPSVLDAVTTGALTDEEHKQAADEVRKLGGLFILGTERHESRRIDNQLRGRAGRQGDPGESRFFVSLEDELWRLFGDRANHPLLRTWDEHLAMDAKMLSGMIQRAQKKVEEHYFEFAQTRSELRRRDEPAARTDLQGAPPHPGRRGSARRRSSTIFARISRPPFARTRAPTFPPDEWDMDELFRELDEYFMLYPGVDGGRFEGQDRATEMIEFLTDHVTNVYESREQEMVKCRGGGDAAAGALDGAAGRQ